MEPKAGLDPRVRLSLAGRLISNFFSNSSAHIRPPRREKSCMQHTSSNVGRLEKMGLTWIDGRNRLKRFCPPVPLAQPGSTNSQLSTTVLDNECKISSKLAF